MMYPMYIWLIVLFSDFFFDFGFINFFVNNTYAGIFFAGVMISWFFGYTVNIIIKIKEGTAASEEYVFLLIWVIIFIFLINEWEYIF